MSIKEELQALGDITSNITTKVCTDTFCCECPLSKGNESCVLVELLTAKNELINKLGE